MNRSKLRAFSTFALLLGGAASPAPAAGDVQAYLGAPSQGGRILGFAEGTGQLLPAQPELRGLRLMPLDYNGRLAADEFEPQGPRWRADVPGAGRIELPGGHGVLYRFERVVPGMDRRFGFLRIDPGGATQLLAERFGTGALGVEDPYGSFIALAPDGASFLVTTTPAAGGDLLQVDLISAQVVDRSAALQPLDFRPRSSRLMDTWSLVVAREGVFRTGLAAQDQLQSLSLDAGTTFYSGEVVLSGDRRCTPGSSPRPALPSEPRATRRSSRRRATSPRRPTVRSWPCRTTAPCAPGGRWGPECRTRPTCAGRARPPAWRRRTSRALRTSRTPSTRWAS
jgi:hypothetical protein